MRLEVGTRIEIHNNCPAGGLEILGYVTELTGVTERYPSWTEVVYGVTTCETIYWYDWTKGPATEPKTIRGPWVHIYHATLHPDGRYGLFDSGMSMGNC